METQAAVLSLIAFEHDAGELTLEGEWAGERPLVAVELSLPLIAPMDDQASSLRRLRLTIDADRPPLRIAG